MTKMIFSEMIDMFYKTIFFGLIFAVIVIIPFFLYGPTFETKYFPVVTLDHFIEGVNFKNDQSKYIMVYNKKRQCEPIPELFGWWLVLKDEDGSQKRVSINFSNKSSISSPIGKSITDIWYVDNINKGEYVSQKLVTVHKCFPFWNSITVVNIPNDKILKQN